LRRFFGHPPRSKIEGKLKEEKYTHILVSSSWNVYKGILLTIDLKRR
jgi:hypothetical protein